MTTDENIQKKKKKENSKFKEAMAGRKEKKKEKKKKKNRLALELDDSFRFTQGSNTQAKPTVKPETSNPRSNDELKPDHLTQDSTKKTKRKKKVAFDLSPAYIRVKRPKFVSSSLQCPKESTPLENEAVRDSESCSQVTVTGLRLGHTHDNDSQCTSEDINSQDLFITQKTFRASPSEPSSGEASDTAIAATPQMITQRDRHLHTSVVQMKQHLEDSHVHQRRRKTNEHVKKPETAQVLITEEEEEEEGLNKAHQNPSTGKLSFQTQMELKVDLTEEKNVCPVHIKPSVVNPYLSEPVVVRPSLDVTKSRKHSCTSRQQSTTSTSTQTENFFTTELSSYLNFCQKTRGTIHFEDLKPLDLSLLQRARKDLGTCLSAKTLSLPGEIQGDNHKDPNLHPSCSSDMTDAEVKKEPSGRAQSKGETTLSPQSEPEPKSADTTTSSEDNEPLCRTGRLDLTQVIPHDNLPTIHCSCTGPCSHQISCLFMSCTIYNIHIFHIFLLEINQTFCQMYSSLQRRKDTSVKCTFVIHSPLYLRAPLLFRNY